MYLLRYQEDAQKAKILFNDLEGLKLPRHRVEAVRRICGSKQPVKEEKGKMDMFFSVDHAHQVDAESAG